MKNINLAEWAIRHRQIVYFFIISIIIGGIFPISGWDEARTRTSPSVKW